MYLSFLSFFPPELRLVFDTFDKDKDGEISIAEVTSVVIAMGQQPNHDRIQALFKQVDLDGKCICT